MTDEKAETQNGMESCPGCNNPEPEGVNFVFHNHPLAETQVPITNDNSEIGSKESQDATALMEAIFKTEIGLVKVVLENGAVKEVTFPRLHFALQELEQKLAQAAKQIDTLEKERDKWKSNFGKSELDVMEKQGEITELKAQLECKQIELDLSRNANAEIKAQMDAWQSIFKTSQLSHAAARLEAAEDSVKRLRQSNDAMRKYLKHDAGCPARGLDARLTCDCGLAAIQKERP